MNRLKTRPNLTYNDPNREFGWRSADVELGGDPSRTNVRQRNLATWKTRYVHAGIKYDESLG